MISQAFGQFSTSLGTGNGIQHLARFLALDVDLVEEGKRDCTSVTSGRIPLFDARPVAFSLTRVNAYTLLDAFGQRPRQRKGPVRQALARVWISTLYGSEWIEKGTSTLERI